MQKTKRNYIVIFLMIWAVQMAAAFYFCVQKQGFHEDEYYTYYSTARTNGFYVEDGQWMERDTYRNEFVVLPGQGFRYGLVKLVQSCRCIIGSSIRQPHWRRGCFRSGSDWR